jgi:uncharacterized protein (DUF2141 family)
MYKQVLLLLCITVLEAKSQNKIVGKVSGLENNKGVCRACLFANEASFNGHDKPVACVTVPVQNKTAQIVFDHVPAGTYAVSVFHDANNNNKMDKNFLGIPKEGYGASLNKLPFASAPNFKDNKFTLKENSNATLNIKIRNL